MQKLFPPGLALLSGILGIAWSAASIAYQPPPADCAAEADRASRGAGTGIGLAISQTIVEAHGGRILAENNPDGGACIRFTLPVARPEVA